jgi:rubredoxin
VSLLSKDTMRLAVILQEIRTWYASSATNPLHQIFHAPEEVEAFLDLASKGVGATDPIPLKLNCPNCGASHIDEGEFAHKPHHTHACQECGLVWRPGIRPTVGVQFLPGFKNEAP